jgi:hypothetical protein
MIFSAGLICMFIAYWITVVFMDSFNVNPPNRYAVLTARTLAILGSTLCVISICMVLTPYLP